MNNGKLKKESKLCCFVIIVLMFLCVVPMILVLSSSLSTEEDIIKYGYSFVPRHFSPDTYVFMFANKGKMILNSLWMSVRTVLCGTLYTLVITVCFAYAVSQKKKVFRFAKPLSFFAWFTTIFSGGVFPWYIMCSQYYGLRNNAWALFIPYGISVWNMFIVRGAFRSIPEEIFESARLDGASDFRCFVSIAIPLAKSGIVTVALFSVLTYWNDFHLSQWLITKADFYTLQKLLYSMLSSASFLLQNSTGMESILSNIQIPAETAKMAVAVIAIAPILVAYPFFFRYFVKGINVGGIKG